MKMVDDPTISMYIDNKRAFPLSAESPFQSAKCIPDCFTAIIESQDSFPKLLDFVVILFSRSIETLVYTLPFGLSVNACGEMLNSNANERIDPPSSARISLMTSPDVICHHPQSSPDRS